MTIPPVGVVGASARAAVMSLARAGYSSWAVDLFADRDLKRFAPVARCPLDRYPDAIPELCEQFPTGPIIYTGGLENHPEVVAQLALRRELWGNGPQVLEQVRDPWRLAEILVGRGFALPRLVRRGEPCPTEGRWLAKQHRCSGGLGVRDATRGEPALEGSFFQEFIPGRAMSAVYTSQPPQCSLLGITEQLIGTDWLHADPYRYAGNIGPIDDTGLASELARLGQHLVDQIRLRGIWGIDFILHNDRPWLIEVNPRYPASVEVLEAACGFAVFGSLSVGQASSLSVIGKAIYFAPHDTIFPSSGRWGADLAGQAGSLSYGLSYADIPEPGEAIAAGWPVLTFFAQGSTFEECRAKLMERAAELDIIFSAGKSP